MTDTLARSDREAKEAAERRAQLAEARVRDIEERLDRALAAITDARAERDAARVVAYTGQTGNLYAAAPPRPEEHALREALGKVNAIRNSIIGLQKINWSEHIYPLGVVLNEAGFVGMPYPEARANYGTMLERTLAAEAEVARLRALSAPPPGEELRERVEALAVEWECQIANAPRDAGYVDSQGRGHLYGAEARLVQQHSDALRAALREDEKGAKP
jgi:hypothetical protein